jgi:hypothetical protein
VDPATVTSVATPLFVYFLISECPDVEGSSPRRGRRKANWTEIRNKLQLREDSLNRKGIETSLYREDVSRDIGLSPKMLLKSLAGFCQWNAAECKQTQNDSLVHYLRKHLPVSVLGLGRFFTQMWKFSLFGAVKLSDILNFTAIHLTY